MAAKTKGQRLIEIIKVFQAKTGGRPFAVHEVTDWARGRGLYPIPNRGSDEATRVAWDQKLAAIAAEGTAAE